MTITLPGRDPCAVQVGPGPVELPTGRMAWRVDEGDTLELLAQLPPDSIDAMVDDPPALSQRGQHAASDCDDVSVIEHARHCESERAELHITTSVRSALFAMQGWVVDLHDEVERWKVEINGDAPAAEVDDVLVTMLDAERAKNCTYSNLSFGDW